MSKLTPLQQIIQDLVTYGANGYMDGILPTDAEQKIKDLLVEALPAYKEMTDKERRVDEYWKDGWNRCLDQITERL